MVTAQEGGPPDRGREVAGEARDACALLWALESLPADLWDFVQVQRQHSAPRQQSAQSPRHRALWIFSNEPTSDAGGMLLLPKELPVRAI